jgi:predicted O-linked N-acetylglucosamine transferase (SPINDLY family)
MTELYDDILKQARASFQTGKLKDAERLFKKVLGQQPRHFEALNLLAIILMLLDQHAEAEHYIKSALNVSARNDATLSNYGIILKTLKRPIEALERFSQALKVNSANSLTWNNRGTVLFDLKRYEDAVADFDKATLIDNNFSDAFCGKGNSLSQLKRYDEAFAAFDNALSLKPDLADAWLGRGNIFVHLKRYDEAVGAFDKARSLKPDLAEAWLGRGNVFNKLKRYDEAFAAYDKALAIKPDLEGAWLGRGDVFNELKRYDEAFAAYGKALAIKPDLEGAWLGRGNVFSDLKRYDEAFAAYGRALTLKPDLAEAWLGRGNIFSELKRYDEALVDYDKAFAVKPELIGAEGARLHAKQRLCNWGNFDAECKHLIASVRNGNANAPPFSFLAIRASAEDQLQCARLWIAKTAPATPKRVWQGERYNHDRIRIAYLSADFHQHPVSLLLAGTFECHDKSHFDVIAISLGPDDNSEIRQRLKGSFERFIDVKTYSDDQIVNLIKELEVDILVDLMGFTQNSRTAILARRCAPIQVNYLGYAGTMGADYFDYLIADPTSIPSEYEKNYAEKIVHLPNSYMPHDEGGRSISNRSFERAEFGLPQTGFVFSCFNNCFKFNPDIFDCWARILKAVEGSVLWLSMPNPTAIANLRKEISARGVSPERLVFANQLPLMAEHLARVRLADLFLDTLPYNAHTTASDALWAGLSVLTCIGETFAGRVAASLLNAIQVPELITTTLEDYEQMAIDLAMHPEKLAAVRSKLAENRLTTPLFNTMLFTKHIEAAYTVMYERHQAGLPPDHIVISN